MGSLASIDTVCDYIIFRLKKEDEVSLSNLKLQKLLYYVQAWNLAFFGTHIFEGRFQAWIHGPVNRVIFDRFRDVKTIYSEMDINDIMSDDFSKLLDDAKNHIDNVLEIYADYSGVQLEFMTHNEQPWVNAREGYAPAERCEVEIDERLMKSYYASRLNSQN